VAELRFASALLQHAPTGRKDGKHEIVTIRQALRVHTPHGRILAERNSEVGQSSQFHIQVEWKIGQRLKVDLDDCATEQFARGFEPIALWKIVG
jgi:hypothetical protein